jgi:hypothetical protein
MPVGTVPDIVHDNEADGEIDSDVAIPPSNAPQTLYSRAKLMLAPIISGNMGNDGKPLLLRSPKIVVHFLLLLSFRVLTVVLENLHILGHYPIQYSYRYRR